MGNDIFSATGVAGIGNQLLGDLIIKTPGKGLNGRSITTDHQVVSDLGDASGTWQDRFDDPRYYSGDTSA